MSDQLVSIVTPVRNGEPYLEECIRSVLAQTHSNFEYIICDNHSTDRSGSIARDFAAMDKRIRIVGPPEFLPMDPNFNYALAQIAPTSAYAKMVLADDWIFPECVERMTRVADAHPNVVLVGGYRLIENDPGGFGLPVGKEVIAGREAGRMHLLGKAYPFGNPSAVMYRSQSIRARPDGFFPLNRPNSDLDMALRLLQEGDFGFVYQLLTFVRQQAGAELDRVNAYNYWHLSVYLAVQEYGPRYLDSDELRARSSQVTEDYYRGLAESGLKDTVLRRQRDDYWDFQRTNLATIGLELERSKLMTEGAKVLARAMSSPLKYARTLSRKRAR